MAAREVIFMPDYGADPVWSADGRSMVSLDRLPIPASLRSRIRDWASRWEELAYQEGRYEDVVNGMLDGPAEPVPGGALAEVERAGQKLCDELRQALGPGWRVAYATFSNGRQLQWEADGPMRPG